MFSTDISHFSHVLAAVQRTGSLPGGEVRGLPDGRAIGGLLGLQSFPLELSEAQKEFQHGRIRSARERIKRLEIQFECNVSRWESNVGSLISDIRQGKRLKNLEKLKELKAAQISMVQLVGPARKAFQDLVTTLDHAALSKAREVDERHGELSQRETEALPAAAHDDRENSSDPIPSKLPINPLPDTDALGSFIANYEFGPRLRMGTEAANSTIPNFELDKFYFINGVDPPRVVRVRDLQQDAILVFDTHRLQEALIAREEIKELIDNGIWILVSNQSS